MREVAHVGAGVTRHVVGGKPLPQGDAVEYDGHQGGDHGQGQGAQSLVGAEDQDGDGQQQANDSDH